MEEERIRLYKLIENNAPYEEILKQSQRLDKYIVEVMKFGYK